MKVGPCLRSWAPPRVVCPSMDLLQTRASESFHSSYPQANVLPSRRRRHKKTVDTSSNPRQKRKRDAAGREGHAADARESRQPKRARLESLPKEQQQPPTPPPCRRSERIRAIGQKKDVAPPPEVKNLTISSRRIRAVRKKQRGELLEVA